MFSNRGVALALFGVSLGVFGIALSILGLAVVQEGFTGINGYSIFGVIIAFVGVIVSLVAAVTTEDNK